MGMAASQARYLALVARKSNCEYEGQQINQARLALSNQSANLFTQMLGLQVPIAPSKQDYAILQYSFSDGNKAFTMDKWVQLNEEDADGYNYAVTYHYNKEEQQGAQKIKTNPQVQFSGVGPTSMEGVTDSIKEIEKALLEVTEKKAIYDEKRNQYNNLYTQAKQITYYEDTTYNNLTADDRVQKVSETEYIVKQSSTNSRTYIGYNDASADKDTIKNAVDALIEMGALSDSYKDNYGEFFYDSTSETITKLSEIQSVQRGDSTILKTVHPEIPEGTSVGYHGIFNTQDLLTQYKSEMMSAKSDYDNAEAKLATLSLPNYIGNFELKPISELSETQVTDINKIINQMKADGIENNLTKCFDTESNLYNNDTYQKMGGLYTYEQNGVTYYTTYYDMVYSYIHGTGLNNIDDQAKLPVYNVQNATIPVNKTEKALLEVDNRGRFTSIRLESDSITYPLTAETEIDEIAYTDAMNQYDYEKALYDKRVSDLNTQTSLIQRQDQDLELRLKQLDTEQNALSTEIDAVAKVVKDNVEKSFKTFGG